MELIDKVKLTIIKQWYLIKSELLSLRLNWKWSLLVVLISPISFLIFLVFLFKGNNEALIYIISGNMIMSLVTGTMLTLGQQLGILKQLKGFDYYSCLSVKKINIILAYLIRATVTSLPSIVIIFIIGKFVLKLNINLNMTFIITVLLSGLSLSGLGSIIGVYSRDASQANIITQVIQPLLVFLAPIYIPLEILPNILKKISFFIPTTYVSNSIRGALTGYTDINSIMVLIVLSIISVILIEYKIDWRTD